MNGSNRTVKTRQWETQWKFLFELALLAEGSEIADPVRLNKLTLELLEKAM